ncbi:MAG: VWA domain-containing protein [Planctomycetales bacterium]
MNVLKSVVEWLLRIPPAEPGQGTTWRYAHHFPWPTWLLVVFAALAVLYILGIYSRDAAHLSRRARYTLALLRMGAVSCLLFMLSEAALSIERTGLPYVVVLLDQSGSMGTEDAYAQSELRSAAEALLGDTRLERASRLNLAKGMLLRDDGALLKRLIENHKLRLYVIAEGEAILGEPTYLEPAEIDRLLPLLRQITTQGEQTRLGDALRGVLNNLRGVPPSAILLFSDGITTDGEKLSAAARYARQKSVPIFTVALGNADPVRDLELHNLLVDDVAFVNDPVTFAYTLTGHGLKGKKTRVALRKKEGGEPLASQEVTVADDGKSQKLELTYTPTQVGELELVLEAAPVGKESNTSNNRETRLVSVRDEKIRVLLVDHLPRWEFRQLKALLEREKTVELKSVLQDADPEFAQEDLYALPHFPVTREELFQYDVLICGDVNLTYLSSSVLENIREFVAERGRGALFIAGPDYNPITYRGTPLEALLPIELEGVQAPPPGQLLTESFRPELTIEGRKGSAIFRFADSERESQEVWQSLPGLFWMIDAPQLQPGALVYATHPVRTGAKGKLPVIVTQRFGNGKVLFHATDELWRWRFRTGDTYYGRYWVQVVRFLARSKLLGKDPTAELTVDRKVYRSGEPVLLRVRFLDEKLAPAANDGVSVVVEKSDGTQKKLTLTRLPEAPTVFEARLTQMAEGKYHAWVAAPSFAKSPPAEDFEIRPSEREMRILRSDLGELQQAATLTGGKMFTLANYQGLAGEVPPGLPVPLETDAPIPLWKHSLALMLLAGLLCLEWILRKRWRLI